MPPANFRVAANSLKTTMQDNEKDTLQTIIDGVKNIHLVYLDRDFNFLRVNEAYAKTCGFKPQEMVGKNHFALYPHEENEAIFKQVRDTGIPQQVHDKPFVFPDQPSRGVTYWDWALEPVKNKEGFVTGLVFSLIETTERKKAEEKVRNSEQEKNSYLESMSDGFVAFDKKWRYTYVNSNAAKILHKTKEELIGKEAIEQFPSAEKFLANFQKAVSSGCPVHFEEYYPEPLNMWYECHCYPTKVGLTVFFSDVTERKKADDVLHRYSARQELLSSITSQLLSSADPQKIVQDICEKIMAFLDCDVFFNFLVDDSKQKLHLNAFAGVPIETAKTFEWLSFGEAVCGCAAKKGQRIVCTNILSTPDPRTALVRSFGVKTYCANPIFAQGKVIGTLSFGSKTKLSFSDDDLSLMRIVTDQVSVAMSRKKSETTLKERNDELEQVQLKLEKKAAEVEAYASHMEELVRERTKELEYSNTKLTETLESMQESFYVIDRQWNFVYANKPITRAVGLEPKDWIGKNLWEMYPQYLGTEIEQNYRATMQDRKIRKFETKSKLSGIWYLVTVFPSVDGIAVLGNNITDHKNLEKAMKDQERLAAIGATAGMVGHDIRNPLQAIVNDVYFAKKELAKMDNSKNKDSAIDSLVEIDKNIEYINKIVQDLQDYARPLNPKPEEVDLIALIERLVTKNMVEGNIKFNMMVDEHARLISTDPFYLNRILYNLVTNSLQAMPKGGKLDIEAKREKSSIVITVKDTGVGIPSEVQSKVFTVMFTTKAKGQGFGLPVVKRMTESLGGTVNFETQEGKGTTFTLRFPDKT